METFKVGDIVEAWGIRGEVIDDSNGGTYKIKINFENGRSDAFTSDGKYFNWHKEPSLKLIERPKKKVKKTYWFVSCSCLDDRRYCTNLYTDKSELENSYRNEKDRQVHSIEIEEEE